MAYYMYKCVDCNKEFEVSMGLMASIKIVCPDCGGWNTRKKFSVPWIHYHSKGFYSTDNKKD